MKYIKGFNPINEKSIKTPIEKMSIEEFIVFLGLSSYEVKDGYIESDSSVNIINVELKKIPYPFSNVFNGFYVINNGLTTLENSPFSSMFFNCSENKLTDLKGCPNEVMEDFICSNNPLLTSLKDGPTYVGDLYEASHNKSLETLDIKCEILGNLRVDNCNIYNLDNFKAEVVGRIDIHDNPISDILDISFIDGTDDKDIIDRIKETISGKTVNLSKLKILYRMLNKEIPKNLKDIILKKGYTIK
jgi:hypothetical protein